MRNKKALSCNPSYETFASLFLVFLVLVFVVIGIFGDIKTSSNDCLEQEAINHCNEKGMKFVEINFARNFFVPGFICSDDDWDYSIERFVFPKEIKEKCEW